jgi:opacity protein-like surface antigen
LLGIRRPGRPFAALVLAVSLAAPDTAQAGLYVAAEAGLVLWPETSNSDQLEADSASGVVVGLAAGVEGRLGRLELEVAHRVSSIHGFNHPDGYCRESDGVCGTRLSGDGNRLHTTSVMVDLWPGMALGERLGVYAGGGVGGAWLSALGDHALTPAVQVGAGLVLKATTRVSVELGYRYFRALDTTLDGLEVSYGTHSPMLRVSYGF